MLLNPLIGLPQDISGHWQMVATSDVYGLHVPLDGVLSMAPGDRISGTLSVSGSPCATTAVITGTVASGRIAADLQEGQQSVAFVGTVSNDGSSASGTYTSPVGGCTAGDRGTWSGSRIVSAHGQTHVIATFAGGGLPNNIPGGSASLSCVFGTAVDAASNLYFSSLGAVFRLDAGSGLLTLVAGNGTLGFSGDNGPATGASLNPRA